MRRPEIVDDGVGKFSFEPGNADELAEKMALLWSNPDLCQEMGHAGRQKAIRAYGEGVYHRRLIAVYGRAIRMEKCRGEYDTRKKEGGLSDAGPGRGTCVGDVGSGCAEAIPPEGLLRCIRVPEKSGIVSKTSLTSAGKASTLGKGGPVSLWIGNVPSHQLCLEMVNSLGR